MRIESTGGKADYPWYASLTGSEIEQGDILRGCPVFDPPADLTDDSETEAVFRWHRQDVIIMTQSCDLVFEREKVAEVLMCPVWARSKITSGHLSTTKGLEEVRRGNMPGYHLLAAAVLPESEREVSIVDFRRVYALPVGFVRVRATRESPRLRLLPPYREHLSQAFARFFMRVGLPTDIPPFR